MRLTEEFPLYTRVVVEAANKNEGSDYIFNKRQGIVVDHGHWFAVKFDRSISGWPNPALICPHNLRRAALAQSEERK